MSEIGFLSGICSSYSQKWVPGSIFTYSPLNHFNIPFSFVSICGEKSWKEATHRATVAHLQNVVEKWKRTRRQHWPRPSRSRVQRQVRYRNSANSSRRRRWKSSVGVLIVASIIFRNWRFWRHWTCHYRETICNFACRSHHPYLQTPYKITKREDLFWRINTCTSVLHRLPDSVSFIRLLTAKKFEQHNRKRQIRMNSPLSMRIHRDQITFMPMCARVNKNEFSVHFEHSRTHAMAIRHFCVPQYTRWTTEAEALPWMCASLSFSVYM